MAMNYLNTLLKLEVDENIAEQLSVLLWSPIQVTFWQDFD
jgi:hypothetical protein